MSVNIIMIILFFVWAYVIWTCKRADLKYQKFLVGSVGLFIFMMYWLEPVVSTPFESIVALISGVFGKITGTFKSYYQYAMLFITNGKEPMSVYVSFECSGIVETFAYISLIMFFELYDMYERVILSVIGILAIFMFNVLRIFTICTIIYFGGNDMYYLSHAIVGRFLFYILSIALYFYVFTKPHIVRQTVGRFSYKSRG